MWGAAVEGGVVEPELQVVHQFDQTPRPPGIVPSALEAGGQMLRAADRQRADRVQVGVDRLQILETREQGGRRHLAHALHAGDVVARIAHQGQEVAHLLGTDPHPLGKILGAPLLSPRQVVLTDPGSEELTEILVTGDEKDLAAAAALVPAEGRQQVVGLEARLAEGGQTHLFAQRPAEVELGNEILGRGCTVGLVEGIDLVAKGGGPGIEGDRDPSGVGLAEQTGQGHAQPQGGVDRRAVGSVDGAYGIVRAEDVGGSVDQPGSVVQRPLLRPPVNGSQGTVRLRTGTDHNVTGAAGLPSSYFGGTGGARPFLVPSFVHFPESGVAMTNPSSEPRSSDRPHTLEQRLGRSRSDWTVDDLVRMGDEDGIVGLSLLHVGADGWLKALDFTPAGEEELRAVLLGGERADGSSLFGDAGIATGSSDIVLRPRPQTAFFDPFAQQPTLCVLCDHLDREGRPLAVSPSTLVRRAHQRLRDRLGFELHALGEVEFFLGRPTGDLEPYGSDDRGYHATSPFVFGAELRRRAMALLTGLGVAVKYGHSEVGWVEAEGRTYEQHEIELALAPLPEAADAVLLTQWVLRNLAHAAGMRCTFDPVVRAGHAGSGLHFHFSPVKGGRHLAGLDSEAASLRPEARALIGALVLAGGALMAFGNREESSFVRLAQGKEAPEAVTWGRFNRHALVRLPIQARSEDGSVVTPPTIEFRLPDGSVHPHLLLAAVAQCTVAAAGLDDLDEVVARSEAGRADPEDLASIPLDRHEVAEHLARHRAWFEAGDVFPPAYLDSILALLEGEID